MNINLSEEFQHLPRAPIVEAVIHLRAKPSVQLDYEDFEKRLKQRLSDYPTMEPRRQFRAEFKAEAGKPPEQRFVDLGWIGLLFRSSDKSNTATFEKEAFAFSRLQPYQNWELFESEALRLWSIYTEFASPVAIQRIGVRFINRMLFPTDGFRLDHYFTCSPQPLQSLGLTPGWFFHHDTIPVPGTNYTVNLIRTLQPPEGAPSRMPVILDIDVFTEAPTELNDALLKKRLAEMRWLKNKIFFGSITENAQRSFR